MSYCADYSVGQYDDWRLPNKDELNQLYEHQSAIGGFKGFTDFYYWSSTEYEVNVAWSQNFGYGNPSNNIKYDTDIVRAVLAF